MPVPVGTIGVRIIMVTQRGALRPAQVAVRAAVRVGVDVAAVAV